MGFVVVFLSDKEVMGLDLLIPKPFKKEGSLTRAGGSAVSMDICKTKCCSISN